MNTPHPAAPAALSRALASLSLFTDMSEGAIAVEDTTDEKRRRVLERLFFHDAINVAAEYGGSCSDRTGINGNIRLDPRLCCGATCRYPHSRSRNAPRGGRSRACGSARRRWSRKRARRCWRQSRKSASWWWTIRPAWCGPCGG